MSRSKKRDGVPSPIKKYITFKGSTGTFKYWDKNKNENVELDDLDIIILDMRASITGFNESLGTGISSNLVKDTTKETLKVTSYDNGKINTLAEGLYQKIKPDLIKVGGKFTQNVICLADVGDGLEIVNIQLSGVALGSWIEFATEYNNGDYYDYQINIKKGNLSKRLKGETVRVTANEESELDIKIKNNPRTKQPLWFYVLSFCATGKLTDKQLEVAIKEDNKLQSYFDSRAGVISEIKSDTSTDADENDDLPF